MQTAPLRATGTAPSVRTCPTCGKVMGPWKYCGDCATQLDAQAFGRKRPVIAQERIRAKEPPVGSLATEAPLDELSVTTSMKKRPTLKIALAAMLLLGGLIGCLFFLGGAPAPAVAATPAATPAQAAPPTPSAPKAKKLTSKKKPVKHLATAAGR